MCLPERKAWSEYVTCHVEHCFKIPEEMSYNDAAALTVDGIVAYSLLFQMGSLSPGKAVLLHSTPGGLVKFQNISSSTFSLDLICVFIGIYGDPNGQHRT